MSCARVVVAPELPDTNFRPKYTAPAQLQVVPSWSAQMVPAGVVVAVVVVGPAATNMLIQSAKEAKQAVDVQERGG